MCVSKQFTANAVVWISSVLRRAEFQEMLTLDWKGASLYTETLPLRSCPAGCGPCKMYASDPLASRYLSYPPADPKAAAQVRQLRPNLSKLADCNPSENGVEQVGAAKEKIRKFGSRSINRSQPGHAATPTRKKTTQMQT